MYLLHVIGEHTPLLWLLAGFVDIIFCMASLPLLVSVANFLPICGDFMLLVDICSLLYRNQGSFFYVKIILLIVLLTNKVIIIAFLKEFIAGMEKR